jgi:pyruvate/2-oxoglutarate dehydrogenase complex dihydrolipoamide acyltransferase (E2) component
MAMTVTMPQLGESVTEGTIARWLKQPGDAVAKYESIAEVVTDKVNAEIPAPAEGVMGDHIAEEGAVIAVGQPICMIETAEQAGKPGQSGQAADTASAHDAATQAADPGQSAQANDTAPEHDPEAQPVNQDAGAEASNGGGASSEQVAAQAVTPGSVASEATPETASTAEDSPYAQEPATSGEAALPVEAGTVPARGETAGNGSGGGVHVGGNGSNGDGGGAYHLTPAVRMLVREHDVDLGQVRGTGLGGRVSKTDVLDFVQQRDAAATQRVAQASSPAPGAAASPGQAVTGGSAVGPASGGSTPGVAGTGGDGSGGAAPGATVPGVAAPGAAAGGGAGQAPTAAPAPPRVPQPQAGGGDEVVPLTPTRRAIAEHMVRSRHTSPHAWLSMEVDMSRVAALRASRRVEFEQHYGVKLTYLPFVARAVCEALRRYPTLNASFTDAGLIIRHDIHLGIAVALEDNLIVPVVRNADRLSIAGLAATMQDLGDRARHNKLKLDEIQGGTFTLNNTGALGTVHTAPIINQPQAAILAMDAVIKRAVVVDDAIAIRPMMNLGLSFDHRINDGLAATRFTKTVKEILENIDDNAAML